MAKDKGDWMLTIEQVRELRKEWSHYELGPSDNKVQELFDTLEALFWVKDEAVKMLAQMKLINGEDKDCIITHGVRECKNHRSIHDMEDSLAPFTAKTGEA